MPMVINGVTYNAMVNGVRYNGFINGQQIWRVAPPISPGEAIIAADSDGNATAPYSYCGCSGGPVNGSFCCSESEAYRGGFEVKIVNAQGTVLYSTSMGFDQAITIGAGNFLVLYDCNWPCPD